MTEVLSRPAADRVSTLVDTIRVQAALPLLEARPLPAAAYWDEDFYEHELEHIWRKDWICIASR